MSNRRLARRSRSPKGRKKQRRGQQRPPPLTTLAIIDRLLLRKVRINTNGDVQKITALEAIIHQLIQKETAGDGRASRVLLKYEELARGGTGAPLQISFARNEYTDALTGGAVPETGNG